MRNNNCILNLLKVIDLLQKNSSNNCPVDISCSKPYLGPNPTMLCFNTRPISLYKRDGTVFKVSDYTVFRVENIDNNCVTLQALNGISPNFTATGEFVTISSNCFCAIRCFPDTSITCL